MRPIPARILFCLIAAAASSLGAITGAAIFFIVTAGSLVFLATSLATSRVPATRALLGFLGHAVSLRLWGAPPPGAPSAALVVESVNIIGFGVHVFFKAPAGRRIHLKVAQPQRFVVTPTRVDVESARYVQWNGAKVKSVPGAIAVSIELV